MGSTSSKFKKNLQQGDEYAAMKIYQNSFELRKFLNPNMSYGQHHHHNTALHYAAKHGMKHLLRAFLNELGGNPNKKNTFNETVLHCACGIIRRSNNYSAQERRAACVQLIILWKGAITNNGVRERVDLAAQDQSGNTALHVAAMSGLKKCVEILVNNGAPLFLENEDKLTACDLAMREGHENIATFLESRMVFTGHSRDSSDDLKQIEDYKGLRSQDLQAVKDQLLIDTSDMLKIPLFTAEALLRSNEWSKEQLLEQWMKDPGKCCEIAGVQMPSSVNNNNYAESVNSSNSTEAECHDDLNIVCEICLNSIPSGTSLLKLSCKHIFCKSCWQNYFNTKIHNGNIHHILCPAFPCHILVPVDFIEKLVSPKTARRYLQFDINAFVATNPMIKWCPIPGCTRAVTLVENVKYSRNIKAAPHAVDCGNGHLFCWQCLGEAHEPCECDQWQEWQKKISEVKPEELSNTCAGSEEAANCLWLVTNSKPCPNCKSPIQKNEGCNHMKCSKCRYDFCWVCQESWKKHSSITGGYFRCNRFEAVKKADEKMGLMLSQALDRNKEIERASKFIHYYTRYKNHENSQKMEEPLLWNVKRKIEVLASSLGIPQGEALRKSIKFIEDGAQELVKARRVLCGSYVHGYYADENLHKEDRFIILQNQLEAATERLSEMIARPYLRTPKPVIIEALMLTRVARLTFVRVVYTALSLVPLTPPQLRKPTYLANLAKVKTGKTIEWFERDWYQGRHQVCHMSYTFRTDQSDTDEETDWKQDIIIKNIIRQGDGQDFEMYDYSRNPIIIDNTEKPQDDQNAELTLALELSRLQMVEDRNRLAQMEAQSSLEQVPGSSFSNTTDEYLSPRDEYLNFALQLTHDECIRRRKEKIEQTKEERKRNAEFTINYFLKSLEENNKMPEEIPDKKDFVSDIFLPRKGYEDGRFKISDIHEKGFPFASDEFDDRLVLRRSYSTGDLYLHSARNVRSMPVNRTDDSPRLDLDSEPNGILHNLHGPEYFDMSQNLPSTSLQTRQLLLLSNHDPANEFNTNEELDGNQKSDSLKADMEVCEILMSMNDETNDENETKKTDFILAKNTEYNQPSSCSNNSFTNTKTNLCTTHSTISTKFAVNKTLGLLSNELKPKQYKGYEFNNEKPSTSKSCSIRPITVANGESKSEKASPKNRQIFHNSNLSKSTAYLLDKKNNDKAFSSKLRIQINKTDKKTPIETDSSNEYESETGIPKSPTLFISGVSISRTPEPNSPGRQSRSSSLSVPQPPSLKSICTLSISCNSLANSKKQYSEPPTPSLYSSPTLVSSKSNVSSPCSSPFIGCTDIINGESKSANEADAEKRIFVFKLPKSSTDGALSSVLTVRESNLSSDDFHEALFLLERSPKSRDSSKKRKRSKKKDKDDKDKDINNKEVNNNDEH